MTYAVDSNVILDILYDDPRYVQLSIDALVKASAAGELIACDAAIRADALISRDRGFLRKWFKALKIIDPSKPSAD